MKLTEFQRVVLETARVRGWFLMPLPTRSFFKRDAIVELEDLGLVEPASPPMTKSVVRITEKGRAVLAATKI